MSASDSAMVRECAETSSLWGYIKPITRERFQTLIPCSALHYLGVMDRVKSGFLAALLLSNCGVFGGERNQIQSVEKGGYDVFDYIDPLIGTINGGD